jgi:hypothetical protein
MPIVHGGRRDFLMIYTGADSSGVAGTKPKFFGKTATLVAVNSAEIECKFYTPKGSQLQDARCVVNYHEIGIYRTANFGKIDPPVADPRTYGLMTQQRLPTVQNSTTDIIQHSTVDYPRKTHHLRQTYSIISNTYGCRVISGYSEIFVSTSITQAVYYPHSLNSNLYDASLSSGLKDLTWEQFTGCTIAPATSTADNGFAAYNGWQRNAYSGTGATGDSLGFKQIPTTGTILVLDMGRTIQLPQEFDAPGNIGQFSSSHLYRSQST